MIVEIVIILCMMGFKEGAGNQPIIIFKETIQTQNHQHINYIKIKISSYAGIMKVIDRIRCPENYDCRDCKHVIDQAVYYCKWYNRTDETEGYNEIYYNHSFDFTGTKDLSKYHSQMEFPIQLRKPKDIHEEDEFIICYNYELKNENN